MRIKFYSIFRILGSKFNYPFKKLGYSNNLKAIDSLPESHFYSQNSFFDSLLSLHKYFLNTTGWLESKSRNQSSRNGKPIPWITYPSFEVLESIIMEGLKIVEIGAGASTLYFENRSAEVTSYEFDADYLESLLPGRKPSTSIRGPLEFKSSTHTKVLDEKYANFLMRDIAARELTEQTASIIDWDLLIRDIKDSVSSADIIFIDGGPRTLVAKICAEDFSRSKLVILDNSDRDYERHAASILTLSDYVEIPFTGLGPLNPYAWTTSFFVREISTFQNLTKKSDM